MFKKCAFLLLVVAVVALGQTSPFSRCAGSNRFPNNITMPGCDGPVCRVPLNVQFPVAVSFTAPIASRNVLSSAEILFNGQWIMVGRDTPMCPLLTVGRCPLVAGNRYAFRYNSTVRSIPVGTRSSMRYRAYNASNATVICFQTNFVIVN